MKKLKYIGKEIIRATVLINGISSDVFLVSGQAYLGDVNSEYIKGLRAQGFFVEEVEEIKADLIYDEPAKEEAAEKLAEKFTIKKQNSK